MHIELAVPFNEVLSTLNLKEAVLFMKLVLLDILVIPNFKVNEVLCKCD